MNNKRFPGSLNERRVMCVDCVILMFINLERCACIRGCFWHKPKKSVQIKKRQIDKEKKIPNYKYWTNNRYRKRQNLTKLFATWLSTNIRNSIKTNDSFEYLYIKSIHVFFLVVFEMLTLVDHNCSRNHLFVSVKLNNSIINKYKSTISVLRCCC